MKKTAIIFLISCLPHLASAWYYELEGKIGDKYPIVMELETDGLGIFTGKYAYRSTLNRDGDVSCSWLKITPSADAPYSEWIVTDCHGKQVETWTNVNFSDATFLTARMKNARGKTYDVVASIPGAPEKNQPLNSYFREHLGDYPSEFKMFGNDRIKARLQGLMGIFNADALFEIIQVEQPIEYRDGMYWSSGFMAHQCCDPAALWAYDSYCNYFYVWIRKDGRDFWWANTENIPLKFQQLVSSQF